MHLACYFGSLMQVLFHLPNIQEKILNFNESHTIMALKDPEQNLDNVEKTKLKMSKVLVKNIQKLFAQMLLSNVKYQDPTKVLESVVDDQGRGISIYEQADIGEFFLNFLERMQDGLGESKSLMRKLMGDDLLSNMKMASAFSGSSTDAITAH